MSQIVIPDETLIREPNLLVPGRKPVGPVKIDWSHPLARGLSLCWLAGGRVNIVDGNAPTQDGMTYGGSAEGIIATSQDNGTGNIYWDTEYLKTSSGDGTGDFTFIVRANPIAENNYETMLGQKWDPAGSPYNQVLFNANGNGGFGASSGSVGLVTYSGPVNGVSAAGKIDGNWHTFFGMRSGTTLYVGRDSEALSSNSGAVADLSSDNRYTLIGNGGRNSGADCYSGQVSFAYIFDRALSDAERLAIYLDPYQFLIPA